MVIQRIDVKRHANKQSDRYELYLCWGGELHGLQTEEMS